jgi:Tfp pilus assembly protein PilO
MTKFIAISIGFINLALFFFWAGLVRIEASTHGQIATHIYDNIAINLTILEIILLVISLLIAVMGWFGFHHIKEGSILEARKVAENEIRRYIDEKKEQITSKDAIIVSNAEGVNTSNKIDRFRE